MTISRVFSTLPIILSILSCHRAGQAEHSGFVQQVAVQRATIDSLSNTMESIGYTQGNYSVTIQARVNGFLLRKCYGDGMPVRRGELLYEIDPSQLRTAYLSAVAAVESSKVALKEAENNYERAIPLAAIEAISQSSLDEYRAQLASSKAAVESAKESLKSAELQLGYSKVYSPIDGIASASEVEVGDYVGPGTQFLKLTTISSLDTVSVTISLPILELQSMGLTHRDLYDNRELISNIRLRRADGSLYPIQGLYDYTLRDVNQGEDALHVVVDFPNPELRLKAGEFARVSVDVGGKSAAVMVPAEAVSQAQGVNSLWVVDKDSVAHFRRVDLGRVVDNMWEIKQGVGVDEWVVVSGVQRLKDGEKVRISGSNK